MRLPPSSATVWADVITGKVKYDFECFPLQIMLVKLQLNYYCNPNPERLGHCVDLLRTMLEKNANLPSAKRDLQKMFGKTERGN